MKSSQLIINASLAQHYQVLAVDDSPDTSQQEYDSEFLRLTLEEAKKLFVSGYQVRRLQTDKKDPRFLGDIVQIPETKLFAASGPDSSQMVNFFLDTIDNKNIEIKHVIAIGTRAGLEPQYRGEDFFDYCVSQRTIHIDPYDVEVVPIKGSSHTDAQVWNSYPDSIITSQVHLKNQTEPLASEKILKVAVLPVDEEEGFSIDDSSDDEVKEMVWRLYAASLSENTLIHCSLGLGRTGQLILLFEILRHYERIFLQSDPKLAAVEIDTILRDMRKSRGGLVLTEKHYALAITSADCLRRYAEKKELLSTMQSEDDVSPSEISADPVLHQGATQTEEDYFNAQIPRIVPKGLIISPGTLYAPKPVKAGEETKKGKGHLCKIM